MLSAILSLLGALFGPLLNLFRDRQVSKAATQKIENQLNAESHSQDITDEGQRQIDAAREANASVVADLGHAGVQQQSADIASAIAAANRELRGP